VDFSTFESSIHKGIHVIGDAAIVKGMPKSGNAANSEAKACAAAVVNLLKGNKPGTPITSNTCYSLVTPDYGISVTAVWEASAKGYKKKSGGIRPSANRKPGMRVAGMRISPRIYGDKPFFQPMNQGGFGPLGFWWVAVMFPSPLAVPRGEGVCK
jgi:hypothetical protein